MRIVNRKRFMLSCIFFTMVMSIFGKEAIATEGRNIFKESSLPVVKVFGKSNKTDTDRDLLKENSKHIIVLDPGHGGVDKGASYGIMNEKDITLKVVKYSEDYLKSKGYTVILTRNSDVLVPLKEIGAKANSSKADIFVSVHINSISDPTYEGVSTYFYDPEGYQKEQRIKLAEIMQKQMLKSDNWEGRGIRRQNLAVLRYSKMPSALVECGYITNKDDRDKLCKDEVLKNIGKSISDGIIEYLSNKDYYIYNDDNKGAVSYIDEVNTSKKSLTKQEKNKKDTKGK